MRGRGRAARETRIRYTQTDSEPSEFQTEADTRRTSAAPLQSNARYSCSALGAQPHEHLNRQDPTFTVQTCVATWIGGLRLSWATGRA